jgi:hypothetical protein
MCEGGTEGAIVFGFVEACLRVRHECVRVVQGAQLFLDSLKHV